ncbi:MAG: outer rane lipoprotein carrier protein LolA [Alphaproteobacteria bacterium]|nr:outer rane lipoprotein carrier protein LolA [Alphaproteobacteria bacterium]
MMNRFVALALAAAPVISIALVPDPAAAQAPAPLAQISQHLQAVGSMIADFAQIDRNGGTLTGTLTLKQPGKVRFQYQKGVPLLIVGDGKALTMIDYEVRQVSRWPIGNSPLSILLNPNKDLAGAATVVQNDDQLLVIQARDRKHPEFGTITIAFAKTPGAPAGLTLRGWTTIDAQNNRSTVKLSNIRFNVPVANSVFRWTDPRQQGPRG